MLYDLVERIRRQMQPPWDHLRERRVLREVERQLEERETHRRTRRAYGVALSMSLGAAALVGGGVAGVESARKHAAEKTAVSAVAVASARAAGPATPVSSFAASFNVAETRDLADGTLLDLSRGARVDVRSETRKKVELAQSAGYVRYTVPPMPGRAFVVDAAGVLVQVKGTIFVVGVDAGKVSVKVERGLVHVIANSGEVELGLGDELSTSATSADESAPDGRDIDASTPSNNPLTARTAHTSTGSLPSADALLERADAERRAGDLTAAAATLRSVVARYPDDRRGALAWFTLGKVERARDRPADGARAFRTSFALAPEGPLGEDALAEEAAAWAAANEDAVAHATAAEYLRRFPNGTHATRMQRIIE
jgi:transmembrane sensor